tara:strand:+ start:340 stop:1302 length:963 start_codon:yes stop_codon:yes gene_type:complete
MTIAFEKITNQVIEALKEGFIPWEKPWNSEGSAPRSINGNLYRGFNAIWLAFIAWKRGYSDPRWVTKKKIKENKGWIKKGEHSQAVTYWNEFFNHQTSCEAKKSTQSCDNLGKDKCNKYMMLRYFNLWNVEQVDWKEGIEPIEKPDTVVSAEDVLFAAEEVVQNYNAGSGVLFNRNGSEAFYTPSTDEITVPNKTMFRSIESYYSTVFHEMGHSTGHESRLNRKDNKVVVKFGSADYAQEELVAEMTNAFLCGHTGINNKVEDDQRVAYIQSWLKALKNDTKLVVYAAAQAQKAADYILAFDGGVLEEELGEENNDNFMG